MIESQHERRKNPRFDCSLPISIRIFQADPEQPHARFTEAVGIGIQGTVGNVSLEGLYLEANLGKDQVSEFVRMNKTPDRFLLEIEAELVDGKVTVLGHVAWCEIAFLAGGDCHFRAGVSLGELRNQAGELWHSFIQSLS